MKKISYEIWAVWVCVCVCVCACVCVCVCACVCARDGEMVLLKRGGRGREKEIRGAKKL